MQPLKPLSLLPVLALSACGSGGGDGPPPPAFPFTTYDDGVDSGIGIAGGLSGDGTPVADLPSGSARYDGLIFLDPENSGSDVPGLDAVGNLRLNADFDTNDLTGTATNFVREDDLALRGTLTVSDGTIGGPGGGIAGFTAAIDGTLAPNSLNTYAVDAAIVADFLGDDADGFLGIVGGTVTYGDTTVPEAWLSTYDLEGDVLGERQ